MTPRPYNNYQTYRVIYSLLLFCPVGIFWGFNHQNLPLQFSLVLGLIALPFVINVANKRGGLRYALLAALAGITLLFFRSSSLYYFATLFLVLFVIEIVWGRLNYLPLLLIMAISPAFSNIIYIWSFPIRVQLSQWAGQVLSCIHMNIQVEGNLLHLDGHLFSVDPACIGLKMVVTSLVVGLLILAYFERKQQSMLAFWEAALLLLGILLGAVLANFIRLLILIVFHILPEHPMHDVVGLLSIALYAILPFYFLLKFYFQKKQSNATALSGWIHTAISPLQTTTTIPKLAYAILLFLLVVNGRQFLQKPVENSLALAHIHIPGMEKTITPNGVLKLQNQEALLYIKPPVSFFQGSHDPRFCWQGSGYTFNKVQLETINDKLVYTALLTKGVDKFYTTWWYENATTHTPHEWNWRWESFKGAGNYYMVNVSCTDKNVLEKWVQYDYLLMANDH